MKSVPYALCVTCAKCRLPQILAKIAPSPPNKWLTNRPLITNTANVTQEERMARSPQRLRAERLQIMLDGEELLALDDFRFKQRMPSRAARPPEATQQMPRQFHGSNPSVEHAGKGPALPGFCQ